MSLSRTLLAGQRRDMGRWDLESSGFFPGFGRGTIVACFHIAGMLAEEIEALKMLHRKLVPEGPRCFRWRMVMLSGPVAVEFLHFRMASATEWGEKGEKFGSSLWRRCILRTIIRVVGSWQ